MDERKKYRPDGDSRGQSGRQSDRRSDKRSGGRPDARPGERSDRYSAERPARQFGERRGRSGEYPGEYPGEQSGEQPVERPYKAALVDELIELDRDLMKLLVRRAKLVGKLRGGKTHAATPAAAKAEKEVRTAWEKNAVSFSRDDKFTRQLFALLQEIKVESRAETESRPGYNLAPARKPVSVNLPGPLSVTGTRMLAVLAAVLGQELDLDAVVLNNPLMDCVKALNSAGARFEWQSGERPGEGVLRHMPGGKAVLTGTDKGLYLGEDLLTMYLMAFTAASQVGKSRFTGGSGLKMADLTPLRRFLPDLGARLAHSVPKSNGLPGSVEASGMLPDRVALPADLPREGVMALFCAVAAWKKKCALDCGALPLPLFTSAVAECLPVLRACSVTDSINGTVLTLDATNAAVPSGGTRLLDPVLCAYLLALPAFAGGVVTLAGEWEAGLPQAVQASGMLARAGMTVRADGGTVRSEMGSAPEPGTAAPLTAAPLDLTETDGNLLPLGLALAVREAWKRKGPAPLPRMPESMDPNVMEGFCAHLGLVCADGTVAPGGGERGESWTAPSPAWAFAFALCAFDSPNSSLANPAVTNALMPAFWPLYNSLPDPAVKKAPEKQEKPRRRIIAE